MARHAASGRWKLGLALSLTTALMWGVLPIALKLTLERMDAVTVTWYRFVVAAGLVGLFYLRRGQALGLGRFDRGAWILMAIVILGLCGNYLFYLVGLNYITPGTAQIVIQLAPMLLLLGALAFFHESFSALQWVGLVVFLTGLALFFNRDLGVLLSGASEQSAGIAFIGLAAVVWAAYALAQKQLLNAMPAQRILLCVYVAAVVLFLPWSRPQSIFALDPLTLALLAFASLNTIVAYGAFAEALSHWEASRVSAVVALAPLLTYAAMVTLEHTLPGFPLHEPVTLLKLAGAGAVVAGSMMAALGGRRARETTAAGAS